MKELRSLRRSPVFSLAVLLAVALSIGPLTAILSVGNWLLWRPHPGVIDSRSLAIVWFMEWRGNGGSPASLSDENLEDIRSRGRTFTGIAGVEGSTASLSMSGGLPAQVGVETVSANVFDVLGVRLRAGRAFTPDEDRGPSGSPVVIISHRLAVSAFGSPDAAVGKSIALNSRPFAIIGVTEAAFDGTSSTGGVKVWLTGATSPYLRHATPAPTTSRADGPFYTFVIRAAPHRTFVEVENELKGLVRRLAGSHPGENSKFLTAAPRVFPGLGLPALTRARTSRTVNTLLAAGGVLLLLGCANVANLLVFRAARREREIAIRQALGASRFRLLRWQLTESWLLAVAGAALGLVLAVYLKQIIEQLLFPNPPGMSFTVPIDLRVLTLTAAVALTTGTLAALAPGWLVMRTRALAAGVRTTATSGRAPKLRSSLAVLQLALSLTLLIGALLLVSTLRHLRGIDLGLDPSRVTIVDVSLREHGYDASRAMAYHRSVLPALQANGQFEAVSLSFRAPFGSRRSVGLMPPGVDREQVLRVGANGVSDSYFRLLSIPIVRGRAFTVDEAAGLGDGTPLIVNETLARQVFGTVDAVGRTVRLTDAGPEQELVVVGVAGDSLWRGITGEMEPFVYQPFGHFRSGLTQGVYLIKSSLPPLRAGEMANAIAARTAAAVPLSDPRPLTTGIDRELNEQRAFAFLLSLLAALGFVLAALGLYGLIAQATIERRREFGIRLALGAAGRDIARLVARYAIAVASIGTVFGLTLSYFATRLIQSLLFGVAPLDPVVYTAAVLTLTVVVAAACVGPAWRAVRVQAVEVLRSP